MEKTLPPRLLKLAEEANERLRSNDRDTQLAQLRQSAKGPCKELERALAVLQGQLGQVRIGVYSDSPHAVGNKEQTSMSPAVTCTISTETAKFSEDKTFQIVAEKMEYALLAREGRKGDWEELLRFSPGESPDFSKAVEDAENWLSSQLDRIGVK